MQAIPTLWSEEASLGFPSLILSHFSYHNLSLQQKLQVGPDTCVHVWVQTGKDAHPGKEPWQRSGTLPIKMEADDLLRLKRLAPELAGRNNKDQKSVELL